MRKALLKNKGLIALTVCFSLIVSSGSVLVAILLQRIIDAAVKGDMGLFQQTLIVSIIYVPLLGLFGYLYSICSKALIRGWTVTLRDQVFRGILRRNFEQFSKTNTADYLSALSNDIKLIEENYVQPLLLTLQNVIIFVASLLIMLFLSPLVTGILVGCMILMFTVPSLFGKALQKRQEAVSTQMSVFTSRLKDMLSGYEVIKSYSMSKHAEKKFAQENEIAANTKFTADRTLAMNEGVSGILGSLTQFAVVFIAAYLILTGKLSAGSLVALVQLSNGFVGPVLVIMQNVPRIQGVKPVVKRIDALAEYDDHYYKGEIEPVFHANLQASQLSFAYKEGRTVLSDIDLTLFKGKKYALVGPSGCGKSTLVKLLSGSYAGYDGSITYDGIELKQLDRDLLQQMVSTIHQQVYMFDTDIRENICLYENYSEEEIQTAIQMSGIDQWISQLPNGLSSAVGENGSNFSGGQRQRIAVARALIRNMPILILDEGTSAVDMQTAYEIENRLLALSDLTLITITHNLNPDLLGSYDQVIYMNEGRIAGVGSLEELLEQNEGFRRFFTLEKPVAV
ncbi:ABC transporter permease [Paenibacillus rhizosphaerae]|uniref:ABC transporter permease n=1 Tax=Paenibacillus rhizosphaerae TaxID=297318 RepID=A0A1R1EFI1_9BACL|nr:ABC transporter ATP-binding protein [Paenibacillus rhizosphaerae]OMF50594.1 ABC transporter permease [Paenibacillus rhizosphaerae]